MEPRVLGEEHFAHPAGAKARDHAVMQEHGTRLDRQG
jgi:hypothetical protein